jgi:hypothetical protein
MLEFEKTYPVIRVYFNSKAAHPLVWSIDDGDQSGEMSVSNVITQGVSSFVYNGQEANPFHPVAWIEFRQARIHRIDDSEDIFIENSNE